MNFLEKSLKLNDLEFQKSMTNFVNYVYAEGDDAGIDCTTDKLVNGTCSLNAYKTLKIREGNANNDPDSFVQDAIFGVTFFIGTIMTLALVYSGILLVMAGADQQKADKGKQGVKYSIYGLLLVLFSYVIIKIIQKFAAG